MYDIKETWKQLGKDADLSDKLKASVVSNMWPGSFYASSISDFKENRDKVYGEANFFKAWALNRGGILSGGLLTGDFPLNRVVIYIPELIYDGFSDGLWMDFHDVTGDLSVIPQNRSIVYEEIQEQGITPEDRVHTIFTYLPNKFEFGDRLYVHSVHSRQIPGEETSLFAGLEQLFSNPQPEYVRI